MPTTIINGLHPGRPSVTANNPSILDGPRNLKTVVLYFDRVKLALSLPATSTDLLSCFAPSCQATPWCTSSGSNG